MIYLTLSNRNVTFTKEAISNITWQCMIELKKESSFFDGETALCVATTDDITSERFQVVPSKNKYFVELLKSNLQKCVRRKIADSALRTAFLLMNINMNQLLRRIINIIAEDSLIHYDMLYCMWLYMANTKGYQLTYDQVIDVLNVIYQISISNYYDVIIMEPNFAQIRSFKYVGDDEKINQCRLAMLLRSIYGGMYGDMIFLRSFVRIWQERGNEWNQFINNYWDELSQYDVVELFELTPENIQDRLKFKPQDKHKFAVDFHCFGKKFIDRIKTDYDDDKVKKAIWYHRSGIQKKQFISNYNDYHCLDFTAIDTKRLKGQEQTKEVWNKIENDVERVAWSYW